MAPKILVVDDEPTNIKLLADLLTAKGYIVATALSGPEALEKLDSEAPDLVLLDVVMPEMRGYEVCQRIRQRPDTQLLPVIMVTALDPHQERIKGLKVGADDFLGKPINQAELLVRVRSLLRIKSLHDTVKMQSRQLAESNKKLEMRVEQQLVQLERMGVLKHFLSPELVKAITTGNAEEVLKSHRREVVVVFLDIRGFTAFAMASEPEEVMTVLREYHGEMGRVITEHEAHLRQFTGDGLMIVFNDPVEIVDPELQAVRMALDIKRQFATLKNKWTKLGYELDHGIGIATGYATIGAVGFEGRWEYGVVGTVSNLAYRLCDEAAPGQILVPERLVAKVEVRVEVEEVSKLDLKGFQRPVSAYNILGVKEY